MEQAFAWLDYMSGVGVQAWFRNFPDLPANLKVPRDLLPTALVDGKGKAFAQDIMHFFRDQLDSATPMWDSPVQDFATDQIRRALEQIMHKVATPRNALGEAEGLPGRARQGAASGRVAKGPWHGGHSCTAGAVGWTRRREARAGLLFVLPWLLSLLLFTAYPVLTTLYLSFTDYNIVQPPGGLACRTTTPCSPPTRRSGPRSGTVRITPCSPCPSVWPAPWAWRCS